MKESRASQVAERACHLVSEFERHTKKHPHLLLPPRGQGITPTLKEFANLVVYFEHASDWGTGHMMKRSVVEKFDIPLFCSVDVRLLPGNSKKQTLGGYGSWLWQAYPGVYAAVFDHSHLTDRFSQLGVQAAELKAKLNDTKARLFMHELGHFVLHRKAIFASTRKPDFAASAEAEMEEEAWLFSHIVFGLALGNRAFLAKVNTYLDNSWEECCFL
jgi:hypothetical protein